MAYAEARHHHVAGADSIKIGLRWLLLLVLVPSIVFGVDMVLRAESLPVRQVRFEGAFQRVTQQQIETAVRQSLQGNFLLLDLGAVKKAVEDLPWVYRASVRRQWPQDVYIRFVEQRLVARWGDAAWLNHAGEVVRVELQNPVASLPRLNGPDDSGAQVLRHYEEFNRILNTAGLKITHLSLTPRRSWHIRLRHLQGNASSVNETLLLIDREQPEEKIQRFVGVYSRTLARQGGAIKRIDLRYTNGFAVEWADGRPVTTIHTQHGSTSGVGAHDPRAADEG
jgi:cell division protein FtsQ